MNIRRLLIPISIVVLAAAIFCGCGHSSSSASANDSITPAEKAVITLNSPQVLDRQLMSQMARAIGENAEFNLADFADMITQCEATVNTVEPEIENLDRNDDPADSFGVIDEYARSTWIADYRTIYEFVKGVQLPEDMTARVQGLAKAVERLNTVLEHIDKTQFNGRQPFRL